MITVISFNSCSEDNDLTFINVNTPWYTPWWQYVGITNPTNGSGNYQIGGYVSGQATSTYPKTRAAVSATYDDKFSLFAWTADSTVMDNFHGVLNGNTWGYTEDTKFFDNFVEEYNFIAVIPQSDSHIYNNGKVTVNATTFSVETNNLNYTDDQEVLWASTTVQKANYSTGANLTFNHANSKIYLKFTSDDPNTQIIDYSPYNPGSPAVPATPGSETEISSKVFDELAAGNSVGWPYGTDLSIYSGSAGTYLNYRGSNLGSAKITNARLAELMPLVNAQFIYTDADGNDVSNTNWAYNTNKKNTVYLKFAPGVDTDAFVAGNDAFWTNLTAEEKTAMQNWYNSGIRVARINQIDGGDYFAWGMMNTQMTIKVISGGTPGSPAVPATGKEGIIILPATSVLGDGTDAVLSTYPSAATVDISLNGLTWTSTATNNTFTFTKPTGQISTTEVASPTTWFTFPKVANTVENLGYTIKFSYIYKGVTVYDARVYIPASKCNWEAGKYYTYVINITGRGNGHNTPNNDPGDDPVITGENTYEIKVNTANITNYAEGSKYVFDVK